MRTSTSLSAIFGRARGGADQILCADGIQHVGRRNSPFCLHLVLIHVDHHLPLFSPIRIGDNRSRNCDQLRAQEVKPLIIEGLLRAIPFPESPSCRMGTLDAC